MAVVHDVVIPDIFAVHFLIYNEHKIFENQFSQTLHCDFYMLDKM